MLCGRHSALILFCHSLCKSHFVQGVLEGSTQLSTLENYTEAEVLTTKASRIQKQAQS